eukprot:TRINITY_DN4545_c0_g2_i2.p1 TRINITY_DN4545_c0_g2~~TRINITY_DN4545_c0_g2_i2.p1  ORF type:complete len:109 (+),score=24.00 TRINITY_DN4545_c0_g2_i2:202-528(+)
MSGLWSLFGPNKPVQEQQKQQPHNLSLFPFASFKPGHSQWVNDIIQLSDDTLVSCSWDKTLKRWTKEGQLLTTFTGHNHYVQCVMEVDNDTFLSGSSDKTIKVLEQSE